MRLIFLPVLTGLLLLSGCGQKGPLYIPKDEAVIETVTERPPQSDTATF
jgi:predicted small lipoprotein YifL